MPNFWNAKKLRFYWWIAAAFFGLGVLSTLAEDPVTIGRRILDNAWRIIYLVPLNYILFEYTVPRIGLKSFFKSLLMIIAHIFMYSVGLYAWRHIGITLGVYTPYGTANQGDQMGVQMGYSVGSVLFFGIIRHIYNFNRLKQTAQQLKIEKQQAELNYLKAQTNPHFLFNTLNNIYSLARDKSELAPESILRLSKMLRYMLYETNGPFVAIEQELKIIDDYIALEKLRYDQTLRVNFNHDVEDMKQSLPPLLLVPLVENAFKHGISETRTQPFIEIHLSVNKRQLNFTVKNSTGEAAATTVKENIGLTNLRRQLELLYTDYALHTEQSDFLFETSLKINLASHV